MGKETVEHLVPSEEKKKEAGITAPETTLIAGATVTTAAVTTGIASAVVQEQNADFDDSLWNPVFSQTAHPDTPINKMIFVGAHNSGSEPNSGTLFFNQNQTLTPYDILSKTPARAIEFHSDSGDKTSSGASEHRRSHYKSSDKSDSEIAR